MLRDHLAELDARIEVEVREASHGGRVDQMETSSPAKGETP
jgi:hypothetical protein